MVALVCWVTTPISLVEKPAQSKQHICTSLSDMHDPGEEEPFPLLGGKAEAFGQPVEKETHSPVVAGQGRMNLVQRVGEGQNQIIKLDAQLP